MNVLSVLKQQTILMIINAFTRHSHEHFETNDADSF